MSSSAGEITIVKMKAVQSASPVRSAGRKQGGGWKRGRWVLERDTNAMAALMLMMKVVFSVY